MKLFSLVAVVLGVWLVVSCSDQTNIKESRDEGINENGVEGDSDGDEYSDGDSVSDGESDIDDDGDSEGDGNSDGDSVSDGESDTDDDEESEGDGNSDGDSVSDGESDTGDDGESDGDGNSDGDTVSDRESDTDDDGDSDGDTCEYDCVPFFCQGTEMSGTCPGDNEICCDNGQDTGPEDTGPEDTGPEDTGPEDTGPEDTGPEDTGPEDTGPEDTGPEDTGPVEAGAWEGDYTLTMYGSHDCPQYGVNDGFNIDEGTCSWVTGTPSGDARTYYGAPGDLATVWEGQPCDNANPPNCNDQQNCGMCIEIQCDPDGQYTYPGDSDTHGAFCKAGASVVIEVVDACPANHPNNTYWCTSQRPNHIDISCTAFQAITEGRTIDQIGCVNAKVRVVDCSVGLGPKSI